PTLEQNTLKWLMIFPLGILLVVLLRNVVGIPTMGTFTPMLVAMSLVRTGFWSGLICFSLIILLGLLIRTLLTRLNLLLVPRISAVVIFVILIMQMLTIFGYQYSFKIAASAVFFPIIITAWIIERASITWEEEGARNATKQIINTCAVAILTYFVISSPYIRHIMFAFNEWNIVILIIVMQLGTYTGYRLVELKRFAPLIKGKE
ncbi:MAG: gonadoliberin III, partial [Alphaproteobacteria bacterium]|nr:gonadoliberin III [Alphaproteobacteria bacterium]